MSDLKHSQSKTVKIFSCGHETTKAGHPGQPLTVSVESLLLLAAMRPILPLNTALDENPEGDVRWGVSRKYLRQPVRGSIAGFRFRSTGWMSISAGHPPALPTAWLPTPSRGRSAPRPAPPGTLRGLVSGAQHEECFVLPALHHDCQAEEQPRDYRRIPQTQGIARERPDLPDTRMSNPSSTGGSARPPAAIRAGAAASASRPSRSASPRAGIAAATRTG